MGVGLSGADKKGKRIRRTAEEARRVILDAAERRLAENGPEGIRLQDIASDIGISHPTILHHFESREGLVLALNRKRAAQQLRDDLIAAFTQPGIATADIHDILDRVFDVLGGQGHSRLVAWMVLGGIWQDNMGTAELLQELTDLIHDLRVNDCESRGIARPERDETAFIIMLGATTALGDGLFGPMVRLSSGFPDDEATVRKFRDRFARLLQRELRLS